MTKPPFTVSTKAVRLVAEIAESLGELKEIESRLRRIELRKENRIKTIQGSLAIENNSLSVDQMTAILDGKHVLGEPREIQEVKNAIRDDHVANNVGLFLHRIDNERIVASAEHFSKTKFDSAG